MNLYDLYPHWKIRTERIILSLIDRTPFELAFRHRPEMRSMGNLYRHIIGAERYWFEDVLGGRGQMFSEPGEPELPNAKSIVDYWKKIRERSQEIIRPYTLGEMEKKFMTPRKKEVTMEYIIWHVLEHEIHHSGQISAMLRIQNIKSPIT